VNAIADFIQITRTKSSAADNASLDRPTSAPAKTDWLFARNIASSVLCGILEGSQRHVQPAVTCAIGPSNLGALESRCICDTILI
jgi:hypothetical protein